MDQTHDRGDADRDAPDAAHDAPQRSANSAPRDAPAPRGREPISLKAALRRARLESAERGDAMDDVRGAETARLDILREQLEPVFAQLPEDCDLFDLGLIQGEKPRLFVDMIAYVEATRDRRGFRFLQDTRNGRVLLAESEQSNVIVQAVADYLARRLVEREKALAAAVYPTAHTLRAAALAPATAHAPQSHARPPRARPGFLRIVARLFTFVIEVLGSAVFFGLLAAGGWWLWKTYLQ